MTDTTVPEPTYPRRPVRSTFTMGDLGLAHVTAVRYPKTGVCDVTIGDTNTRVVLSDDPGVLMALLEDAIAQLGAIFR